MTLLSVSSSTEPPHASIRSYLLTSSDTMPADRHTPQHLARYDELPDLKPTNNDDDSTPKKQAARRRAYAKRSCLKCREKKARCELPEQSLTVPSSMTPLTNEFACHRCKVLSLDCVVWDGDRKRRPKALKDEHAEKASSASTIKSEPRAPRLASSPPRSPGSLDQLAAAAARLSDQRTAYDDAPDMSPHGAASSNDASSSREAASTLASVQFFNPVVEEPTTPLSAASPSSMRPPDRTRLASNHSNRDSAALSPADRKALTPGSMSSPHTTASSGTPTKVQPPGRTWTSLWRPLSVLIDYAAQQPSFTTYLLMRIDPELKGLDILDLIPRRTLSHLKPFLKPYLLWHPHLPSLDQMYAEHCKRPTVSSALLLSSMCLVACRHAMPLTDALPVKLSTLVDQLGTQILLSTPRDMYTVQALELLLAHDPSLVGTSVAGNAQAERGNGLLGESLLAAALTIARGLDLDKSIDHVVDLTRRPPPPNETQARTRRESLSTHLAGASIWLSLRIWEGHFSFVNSTVRPIDLNELTSKIDVMVAIDNNGRPIDRTQRDPFQSIEKRFPGLDEDSILRSAGRTGLVYRLKAMARFQDTIAGMYRILATATKPEEVTPSKPIPTTEQTRQEMLELLTDSSNKQVFWQCARAQAFAPFASVRPALLLEDWATMESYSLQELLPCLAICAFMTGELNCGFSAQEMVEALRVDVSFRTQSSVVSDRRDVETHYMLSAFHLFDRGLGYSQPDIISRGNKAQRGSWIEATGAPLLLTTAIATDGCKTFLEKTACSLYGFDNLNIATDMHIVMMINTLHRLEECDRNEYLPPKRSMPPPSRRLSGLVEEKEEVVVGRSISQVGVIFIEEMVQVMQKWKLGASLQRIVPYHFRHVLGPSSKPTRQRPSDSTAVGKREPEPQHSVSVKKQRTHPSSSSIPSANPAIGNGEGTLGQAQTFSSFPTGLPSQPPIAGSGAQGGQGGMFDIPMFDLFGPTSTTDWTNNVPWFDPVEGNSGAMGGLSSLVTGGSGWEGGYQQPAMGIGGNTWPGQRQQHTLPPLHFSQGQGSVQQGQQGQQGHAYGYGYSGYGQGGQPYADQNQLNGSHPQQQQQHYQRPYYGGGVGGHHGTR